MCTYNKNHIYEVLPWLQDSWAQHEAHLRPTGPMWAPCWPNELCYLGWYRESCLVRHSLDDIKFCLMSSSGFISGEIMANNLFITRSQQKKDYFIQFKVDLWSFLSVLPPPPPPPPPHHLACIIHYYDVIMGRMASQVTSLTIVYSTFYSSTDQRKSFTHC